MKKIYWVGCILVLISGCRTIQTQGVQEISRLTPYVRQESTLEIIEEVLLSEPAAESVLLPTATPVRHIVALGETFSSISLQYGVTINAIKSANPDFNPNTLIVGDELIIPVTENTASATPDPKITEMIQFSILNCVTTRDGGLWCAVLVNNQGEEDVEELVVTFSFFDQEENLIEERSTPTIMNRLLVDSLLPAVVFLDSEPPNLETIIPNVFSGQILDPTNENMISIEIEDEKQTIEDHEAILTGNIRILSDQDIDQVQVWIAVAAFDGQDVLIGVRRLESIVFPGEITDFKITVYALESTIARVQLYSEAFLIE